MDTYNIEGLSEEAFHQVRMAVWYRKQWDDNTTANPGRADALKEAWDVLTGEGAPSFNAKRRTRLYPPCLQKGKVTRNRVSV